MTSTSSAETAGTKTVLVIDEDPNELRVLAGLLSDAGYRAVIACGAEDAWRKLARQRFDVALVELAMKQVSGIRMIEMMRTSTAGAGNAVAGGDDAGAPLAGLTDRLRRLRVPTDPSGGSRAKCAAHVCHAPRFEPQVARGATPGSRRHGSAT